MINDCKICGVTDLKTLNYLIDHPFAPKFIGFICNYKKSSRFLEIEKIKELTSINKKNVKIPVKAIFHPAYLLRNPSEKKKNLG